MEEHGGHPQDAYELGRAAVAKLKEQNDELSYELPNALQTLFSDTEFQDAIVESGVTNQRQTLTPVAKYQMARSTPSRSARMLPRTRRGQQNTISSRTPSPKQMRYTVDDNNSNTLTSYDVIHTTEEEEMVLGGRSPKSKNTEKNQNEIGETSGSAESQSLNSAQNQEIVIVEKIAGSPIVSSDLVESSEPRQNEDNEVDTNCLCCNAPLEDQTVTNDPNNVVLRELLWLSLGMKKFYDRTSLSFPFCENCSSKTKKLFDICKQVAQLEDEFNEIRLGLCEGIISKHVNMTKAARNATASQKVQLKSKIIKRMEGEFSIIIPGNNLLKQVARFTDTVGTQPENQSEADGNSPESNEEVENSQEFECRFCDKTFVSQGATHSHERIHKIKGQFRCSICDKSFLTTRSLNTHTKIHKVEKSYKCSYCDKLFSNKGNLDDHTRRHIGFKPLQCTICFERYFVMKHVRAHFRKRHPDMDVAKNVTKHSQQVQNPNK